MVQYSSIKAQKKKKEKEKKEKGGWRTPLSFRMPPPPPRMRRYFATTRVTVSVPRTSARLARLHAHVQHLRALNAAHFPEAEAAAEGAKRAKRAKSETAEPSENHRSLQPQRAARLRRDPARGRHLAMTVRALLRLQEYFRDGLEGGIFTTRSAPLLERMRRAEM